MFTYHPKSWSNQAREMGDTVIYNVNKGNWCIEEAIRFFQHSYRHSRIVNRAAKRFGRAMRAGKVHESPEAVTEWAKFKAEHYEYFLYVE